MGRFGQLTPRPAAPPPRPAPVTPARPYSAVRPPGPAPAPAAPSASKPAVQPNGFQSICLITLGIYLLSGYLNDIMLRLLGSKAYLSLICVYALPLVFLMTGSAVRGLRHRVGKLWLGFAIWIILSAPFSIWRTGTLTLLWNYLPKAYILFFYFCASIISVRQLRFIMNIMLIGAFCVLLVCFAFGMTEGGRFSVPGSIFFGNANEVGLQLLLNIILLMYVFLAHRSKFLKVMSFIGIGLSLQYMLKTGSRGEFLAFLIVISITFILSRRKLLFLAISVPVFALALYLVPTYTRQRLTLIVTGTSAVATSMEEQSTIDSQMQREQLIRDSIAYSFEYPIFGVGAGQFAVRVAGDKEKRGQHPEWLGTHNTYTQVSSETGLPALIIYTTAIVICIRTNYSLLKRTRGRPELQEHYAIAFSMFLSCIAYAFSTFFFHIAYSAYLPILMGISIANYLVAKPSLDAAQKA